MPISLLAAVATLSGTVSGLLPLLQIARMRRARSAAGLSLGYVAGGIANASAWDAYGFALHSRTIVFSNSLWVLTGSTMLAVAAGYRRGERPVETEAPPAADDAPTVVMPAVAPAAVAAAAAT